MLDHFTNAPVKSLSRSFSFLSSVDTLMMIVVAIAYVGGLFVPLMNNDSAHHANIALTMLERSDFVTLLDRGKDYLDKPHVHFWLSALSFKIFGVNTFAYKFPSILLSILALCSTYALALYLYSGKVAKTSVLILSTSYAFFLANNDVRMDAILTGSIIFSIWQLILFADKKTWSSIILSALGLALGFGTKGLIGIVTPSIAITFYVVFNNKWTTLKDARWLLLSLLVLIFISPLLYCFYLQFDLHPEKVIRGNTGNSGIAFLLFGQSIQRYSGSGWGSSGSSDPLFYVHTFLWAFLPWSIVAVIAMVRSFIIQVNKKFKLDRTEQFFIPATIVVVVLIISGSSFKLPHYLNVVFPLVSIHAAYFLVTGPLKRQKWIRIAQYGVIIIILVLTAALNLYTFPIKVPIVAAVSVALCILLFIVFIYHKSRYKTLTLISTALLYFSLNFNFYPRLLEMQAGNVLAEYVRESNVPVESISYLEGGEKSNSFDFYVGHVVPEDSYQSLAESKESRIVYADTEGMKEMMKMRLSIKVLDSAINARISKIDASILDPGKRRLMKPSHYLIRINK